MTVVETNNGRIGKPPEVLLEFHKRKLAETVDIERLQIYHSERIAYLSALATVHVLHTPLEQANVIQVDFGGANEAA